MACSPAPGSQPECSGRGREKRRPSGKEEVERPLLAGDVIPHGGDSEGRADGRTSGSSAQMPESAGFSVSAPSSVASLSANHEVSEEDVKKTVPFAVAATSVQARGPAHSPTSAVGRNWAGAREEEDAVFTRGGAGVVRVAVSLTAMCRCVARQNAAAFSTETERPQMASEAPGRKNTLDFKPFC